VGHQAFAASRSMGFVAQRKEAAQRFAVEPIFAAVPMLTVASLSMESVVLTGNSAVARCAVRKELIVLNICVVNVPRLQWQILRVSR